MNPALPSWLDARQPQPPAPLRSELEHALAGVEHAAGGLPELLGGGALVALRAALRLGDDRAAAFPLLAADALLTYAMEAAAEQGPDVVEDVAAGWGAERLAALLEEGDA